MFIRSCKLGSLAAIIAAGATVGYSQSVTTGALQISVQTSAGAPVPGASVHVSSGQIDKTLVTGTDGRVYFPLLNAGGWNVSVSHAGMATSSRNLTLNVNETKAVVVKMAAEAVATVEVLGSVRAVDQSTTTTGANISLDIIDSVPKARDVSALIFLSPGVTSGGFATNGLNVSINGASGAENSWSIDGLSSTDFRYGGRGASLNTDFVDQVEIQTGGFKPEFSALGGVFNVLTKSGSNNFTGTLSVSSTPTSLQPGAKRTFYAQEARQTGGTDLAAWVGGALIKDKVFYSVGAYGNFTNQPGLTNFSGLTADDTKGREEQYFVKVNWYLTTDQQLTFNVTHTGLETKQTHGLPTTYGSAEFGATVDFNTNGASFGYDWTITPTLYLNAKIGQSRLINTTAPTATETPIIFDRHWFEGATSKQAIAGGGNGTLPAYLSDATTPYARGGFGLYTREYNIAKQGNLNLTWILGDHSIKMGFSDLESTYALWERVSGDHRYTIDGNGGRLRDRVISNDASVKAVYRAYYVQDTWQINPTLNVFFGFRAEDQDQFGANGQKFLSFKAGDYVQPRVGFTWDPKGNAKSKFFGSYAIYYEAVPQRAAIREFGGEYFVEKRYYSNLRQAGAKGQYLYSSSLNQVGTYNAATPDKVVNYGASFLNPPIQDGIKLPRRNEFQIGYQETLSNGWSLGATYKYRKLENVIEDSVFVDAGGNTLIDRNGNGDDYTLGGQPAIIWNPGSTLKYTGVGADGKPLKYDFTGIDTLYPKAFNRYRALELTAEKKSEKYFISINYVLSRLEGNYQGLVSSSNGQPDANITASFDYWPYAGTGLLPLDHTHTLKAYGSYRFLIGGNALIVGANFLAQTGTPISHFDNGNATFGDGDGHDFGGYGNDTPVGLTLGQFGRRPTATKLDMHFEMEFNLSGKMKLAPYIDAINIYNSRPITATQENITDAGGSPNPTGFLDSASAWQTGRSVRFGAKLRF